MAVRVLDELVSAVREKVSGERALEAVRAIARFHRVQASPGLDQAADWLADAIERAGLKASIERLPADGRTRCLGHLMPQGWACERAIGVLHGDGPPRTIADLALSDLAVVIRSLPVRGRFPLVSVEDGTERAHFDGMDVAGSVVITRGDVHRVHQLAVIERGAAGLLSWGRRLLPPVRDDSTDRDALAYTSFWWGSDQRRGWGLVISPAEASKLLARLAAGARLELDVTVESRAFDTTIPVVSALGPAAETDEEVVILSHLCHPRPSANDNASGVAANLEAAHALASLGRERALPPARRRVRHVWMPELTGTYAWLAARGAATRASVLAAAVNLDMVGEDQAQCGSTLLLEHPPCFSASFAEALLQLVREQCSDWVTSFSGPGHVTEIRMAEVPYSGGSDHSVLIDPAIGVPCPMLVQWPDRYYHSSLDTPDRCSPGSLALAARSAAVYALFVARAGVAECEWLAERIARRARVRLMAALDAAEAPRQARAECLRLERALESLRRLSPGPELEERLRGEQIAVGEFVGREIAPRLTDEAVVAPAVDAKHLEVPVRRIGAPLHYQRWLLSEWETLPASDQERWREDEAGAAQLAPLFDLAWSACDGIRSVRSIADLVWLESGRRAESDIARFFSWTCALGLSDWRAQGSD